jgi:hypothetical protein
VSRVIALTGVEKSLQLVKAMPEDTAKPSERFLNPMERVAEILFGLIMVLTITCSFSVAGAGSVQVRQMLIGALGCNVAWGIIDAVMYLMGCFSAQGRGILALRAVRRVSDPSRAHRIIADSMPPLLASVTTPAEFEVMRLRLNQLPDPGRPGLTRTDWLAALGVFLLVLGATLPVCLPFVFVADPTRALRTSNGIAIVLLFMTGYVFGRYAGYHPWRLGLGTVFVGSAMVGLAIALGG